MSNWDKFKCKQNIIIKLTGESRSLMCERLSTNSAHNIRNIRMEGYVEKLAKYTKVYQLLIDVDYRILHQSVV